MGKIVAIGGGDIRERSTLAIDREIIRLSDKQHPRLLFLPTASSDSKIYWDIVRKYFTKLGCKTDVLFLIKDRPSQREIKRKILSADIIYVGGGNTLEMMRVWRRFGVDNLLRVAYHKGIVLSGISAGVICWFEWGHSDSMSFYRPKNWNYIRVAGMGLIKGIHCPHFDGATRGQKRKSAFVKMIKKIGGTGIAIDGSCAIQLVDGTYRLIQARPRTGAYSVFKKNGRVVVRKIVQTNSFRPISELYSRK